MQSPHTTSHNRAQELCESQGGRPGLPPTVSVDVKQHSTSEPQARERYRLHSVRRSHTRNPPLTSPWMPSEEGTLSAQPATQPSPHSACLATPSHSRRKRTSPRLVNVTHVLHSLQLPDDDVRVQVHCCFTSTETIRTVRGPGRPPRLSHSS